MWGKADDLEFERGGRCASARIRARKERIAGASALDRDFVAFSGSLQKRVAVRTSRGQLHTQLHYPQPNGVGPYLTHVIPASSRRSQPPKQNQTFGPFPSPGTGMRQFRFSKKINFSMREIRSFAILRRGF